MYRKELNRLDREEDERVLRMDKIKMEMAILKWQYEFSRHDGQYTVVKQHDDGLAFV